MHGRLLLSCGLLVLAHALLGCLGATEHQSKSAPTSPAATYPGGGTEQAPPPPPEQGGGDGALGLDEAMAAMPMPQLEARWASMTGEGQPAKPDGSNEDPGGAGSSDTSASRTDVPAPGSTGVPTPTSASAPAGGEPKVAAPLLIYRATLTMAVYEATPSIDAMHKLALEAGGYLVRRDDRSITVRVPSEKLRDVLAAAGKLGDVLHREETVEDVTDKFFDMEVRLRNARAMRQRLAQLLEQAKTVEEALMVERELGRVTQEIEQMEGQLKLLRELIRFSTITVAFEPRATDSVQSRVPLPFPWLHQLGLSRLLSL